MTLRDLEWPSTLHLHVFAVAELFVAGCSDISTYRLTGWACLIDCRESTEGTRAVTMPGNTLYVLLSVWLSALWTAVSHSKRCQVRWLSFSALSFVALLTTLYYCGYCVEPVFTLCLHRLDEQRAYRRNRTLSSHCRPKCDFSLRSALDGAGGLVVSERNSCSPDLFRWTDNQQLQNRREICAPQSIDWRLESNCEEPETIWQRCLHMSDGWWWIL